MKSNKSLLPLYLALYPRGRARKKGGGARVPGLGSWICWPPWPPWHPYSNWQPGAQKDTEYCPALAPPPLRRPGTLTHIGNPWHHPTEKTPLLERDWRRQK